MIGERLKEERKRLGLSQEAFAEKAGATRRPYIDWEAGKTSPTAVQLAALAAAGADVRYVLTGERDGPPPLKPDEQTLLDGYRVLDAATKRRMLAFVLGGETPTVPRKVGQQIGGSGHQITNKGKIINKGNA
jgi:transcriptional regulator with XRE-family HTH domain